MLEDYKNALKSGQRAYRACVARGQSPYLAVLDDILVNVNIVAQEPLGLVEIPAESIVGTKTSGRHTAFAPNFMPLLEPDTEFAGKWSNLCDAHLDEGIHTPIIAYEFLNKFYVQEGNKRVSVLKYFDAVRIAGTVTRLVPERNDSLENRIYYEFLDFYKLSKVNDVHFSRLGGYAKLQTLVCKASGESWTDDDRLSFSSFYTMFRQQFLALGGGGLNLTAGDAMLVYLSVYRYADACESTPSQMKQNLELSGNQIHDTHRRFLECQKVIIQIERPALVVFRDRIDHLKNTIRRLLCRNRFHIRSLNDTFVHGITDQLFQFPVDIAHIRSRLAQKKLHHRSRNILSLFFQARQHPARNQFFRLGGEFHYFSGVLDCLVHLGTLVHFLLHKHEIGACSGLCQILRKFIAGIFEKTAVLDKNDSALRKKRKGLRKINNLLRVDVLSLEAVKIHIAVSARQHAAHPGILSRRSERVL